MRIHAFLLAGVTSVLGAGVSADRTWAETAPPIDIPAQALDEALKDFGEITGLHVIAPSEVVEGHQSPQVTGEPNRYRALSALLAGTGLSFVTTSRDSVAIVSRAEVSQNSQPEFIVLPPIVVTARRTEEELDDVPASVVVLGAEDLDVSNINDFRDAAQRLPNVSVATPSDPRRGYISIRGIGNFNIAGTAPTVGVFQDGVLQNSSGLRFNINPNLVDLDRVEVVYGPQGTSFGRGTVAGAINYVTAKPRFEQEASVKVDANDLFEVSGEAMFNTPLSDSLALRAVLYGAYSEGFVETPFVSGTDTAGDDNRGARVSLRYQPNDRLTVDGSVQYDLSHFDAPLFAFEDTVDDGDPTMAIGEIDETEIERLNARFEIAYDTDFGLFTATTGYLDSSLEGAEDFDGTPDFVSRLVRDNFEETLSQELRFESVDFDLPPGFGAVAVNLGASYSDMSRETQSDFQLADFLGLGPGGSNSIAETDQTNWGVFGDIRWKPNDRLEITIGGRYSDDDITTVRERVRTGSRAGTGFDPVKSEGEYSAFTPNASILYDWTDNFTTFASFSTGYRPGGFVGLGELTRDYEEEFARSYEIGLRSTFLDGTVAVNASVFRVEYEDMQVPIPFDPARGLEGGVENAAEAESQGIEVSVTASPLPGLTLGGGYGYTDAEFTDFSDSVVGDKTGDRLPNAPESTFNVTADYELQQDFRGATPFIRGEFFGSSSFTPEIVNDIEVGDYTLLNLRAGLRGDNFDLVLYIENVFDEEYALDATGPVFGGPVEFQDQNRVTPGEPRKIGLAASYRF